MHFNEKFSIQALSNNLHYVCILNESFTMHMNCFYASMICLLFKRYFLSSACIGQPLYSNHSETNSIVILTIGKPDFIVGRLKRLVL